MKDESHLPVSEQSLVFRLRKRAEIRRQIPGRLSATEGKPDKIANLLDEAADEIERYRNNILAGAKVVDDSGGYEEDTLEKYQEFVEKRNYKYE
jgi:hypothetical protein